MFGTKNVSIDRLKAVLDRHISVDSLESMYLAINPKLRSYTQLESVALGIDSSVFLRLAKHKKREDILDYLRTKHSAPLILPGQAVQEYWNNQHSAISTKAKEIKKIFSQLKHEIEGLDSDFENYAHEMESLLNRFDDEYGYIYDASTNRHTLSLLEMLKEKASLSYVPRIYFSDIARNRKRTKTPPGFKDDGDGDFFIWADFLYGLLIAKEAGLQFDRVVLLTNDTKVDWSLAGTAHPVLVAEVEELFGVPFDVWTAEQLGEAITLNS